MNTVKLTLLAFVSATLAACGADNNEADSQSTDLQFDRASVGQHSGVDLALSDVTFVDGPISVAGKTVSIEARLLNNGSNSYDMANVSMALEYSVTQDFDRVYKTVVFDIRTTLSSDNAVNFTARTSPADLPDGSYFTRLSVNPDWRLSFDNLSVDSDYSRTSRYQAESDYTNNFSDIFQFDVTSQAFCSEDSLEPNNDFINAVALQPNGMVNASLCEDDIDLYAIRIDRGQSVAATLANLSGNQSSGSRYVVIDPQHKLAAEGAVAVSGKPVVITATTGGVYYLAVYGQRADYSLSLSDNPALFNDPSRPIFTTQSVQGPYSPVYGPVQLKKLSFDESSLVGTIVTCGILTASYQNEQPVWYSTPQHFSANHVFQFAENGSYYVDGALHFGWSTPGGDVSNAHWYTNLFPGWAEDIGDGGWRYWERDGLSYVECRLK